MGYIEVYIKDDQNPIRYNITELPTTLFDTPTQIITIIKKIREENDPTVFIFTLYTKDYKINLIKTAHIYNDPSKNETIVNESDRVILNLYTTEYLKLTVQAYEKNIILNKRIYLTFDKTQFSCDECFQSINECRQNNNIQTEYYRELEKKLRISSQDFSHCNEENAELKKLIDSMNQENKKCNDPQSTSNTSVIICVAIIVLLLGLCIYLYFYKH